jgi:serine/threonine protein kinase/class 3 adenylate cyclase
VLLFTDIVGSTELKSPPPMGVGETAYFRLQQRHNVLFESLLRCSPGARWIKPTGDGYFAEFPTPSDAVRFALRFQLQLMQQGSVPSRLSVRIGIHMGQFAVLPQAGISDLIGKSADICNRVMTAAVADQIILTKSVADEARRYLDDSPEELGGRQIEWKSHGRYSFTGADCDDPVELFEVGIAALSPFCKPLTGAKVWEVDALGQRLVGSWLPSPGKIVPGRENWILDRCLGGGGFGEVWLVKHRKLGETRVFKFCLSPDRLRGLKREYTLLRLLKESLGNRPDIVKLIDFRLDGEPPYFLECEYAAGGNLLEWSQRMGGIQNIPLEDRLEIVARLAEAVAAAHSVDVLHKDIKPSNILIDDSGASARPRLIDFGIGTLTDRSRLDAHAITATGFTQQTERSSQSGTRMYLPPESHQGKQITRSGDVYALGVLLYQMVIGDLNAPLGTGWEVTVRDELLREDIERAVWIDPNQRLCDAIILARRISTLPFRRKWRIKGATLGRRVKNVDNEFPAYFRNLVHAELEKFLSEEHLAKLKRSIGRRGVHLLRRWRMDFGADHIADVRASLNDLLGWLTVGDARPREAERFGSLARHGTQILRQYLRELRDINSVVDERVVSSIWSFARAEVTCATVMTAIVVKDHPKLEFEGLEKLKQRRALWGMHFELCLNVMAACVDLVVSYPDPSSDLTRSIVGACEEWWWLPRTCIGEQAPDRLKRVRAVLELAAVPSC